MVVDEITIKNLLMQDFFNIYYKRGKFSGAIGPPEGKAGAIPYILCLILLSWHYS